MKINNVDIDDFSTKFICNSEFYLIEKKYLLPENYSLERLLFLICAIEPLLELFFALQHFSDKYSSWVKKKLRIIPENLQKPDQSFISYFEENIAFSPEIKRFLKNETEDIDIKKYLSLSEYRNKILQLKQKEKVTYNNQKGKELINGLENHIFKLESKKILEIWNDFIKLTGKAGDDLRKAFISGGYPLVLDDNDFREFIFNLKNINILDSSSKERLYSFFKMRIDLFKEEKDAKKIAELFTGIFSHYKDDFYKSKKDDIDLISLFNQGDKLTEIIPKISKDLENHFRDFFYISDYGYIDEKEFKNFDILLDSIVEMINEKYLKEKKLSDIWQDVNFKFLYLMCALWFKYCYKEKNNFT